MLLSFNNDLKIKESLIARMQKHIEADELLQQEIGQNGKGCTVWCALNNGDIQYGYDHSAFPEVLGLPEWLAHLQDIIFEGLSVVDAKQFSSDWPKAIPVGKNLEPVKWKFCAFLMKQNIERVLLLNISEDFKKQVVDAINGVLSVHQLAIESGKWDEAAARAAARAVWAAWAATEAAARAARAVWAAWAATEAAGAAWAAAGAAAGAAGAAAGAAGAAAGAAGAAGAAEAAGAAGVAGVAAYKIFADKLLTLLSEA